MPNRTFYQVSFSFTQKDADAASQLLTKAKAAGLKARLPAVLRALITLTPEKEMYDHAVTVARAELDAPSVDFSIVERPQVNVPATSLDRLDRVVTKLARAQVVANRSSILRALLRAAKPDAKFITTLRQYLKDNPYKPRGLSKLRLDAKQNLKATVGLSRDYCFLPLTSEGPRR